jgi:hypothetical protein
LRARKDDADDEVAVGAKAAANGARVRARMMLLREIMI